MWDQFVDNEAVVISLIIETKPIYLTMWDQFVDNEAAVISLIIETKPIIIGVRLEVVSYNGKLFSPKKLHLHSYTWYKVFKIS